MGERVLNFKKFITKVDEFDAWLLKVEQAYSVIDQECQKEITAAKSDKDKYVKGLVQKYVATYTLYKQQFEALIKQIDDANLGSKISNGSLSKTYHNAEEAKTVLSSLLTQLDELSKALNNYSFQESKYAGIKFTGESVKIGDKEYNAPDFPDLSEKDFDTDDEYGKRVTAIYQCYSAIINCLNYLILYYTSDYIKDIDELVKKTEKEFTEQIKNKWANKKEEIIKKAQQYYQEHIAPFIKENTHPIIPDMNIDSLEMPLEFNKYIHVGDVDYAFKHFKEYQDFIKLIDSESLVQERILFPLQLDLSKNGNIFIQDNQSSKITFEFINQLILQYISNVPSKKMNLALIDVDETDVFDFVGSYNKEYLRNNKLLFTGNAAVNGDQFRNLIDSLALKINEVKGDKLSPKNCENIFQYNEISRENSQEMFLMVYANCPKNLDLELAEKISNLMLNGNRCGIYSIIFYNKSLWNDIKRKRTSSFSSDEDDQVILDTLSKMASQSLLINSLTYDGFKFTPTANFSSKDINAFFDKVNNISAKQAETSSIIPLDTLMGISYEKPAYYDKIKIPVGKDGGDPVFLTLSVGGTGTSSALIAGATGSGKSSFLHTIVLSGAYNYSPDELEFCLIDFKDGVEFNPYQKEMKISHVSFLSLKNKVEDAYDILSKIYNENTYRNDCFKKAGVSDLKSYQTSAKVISGELPSFKSKIVIIDEYQNFLKSEDSKTIPLCNKCAGLLLSLLQKIRNAGIYIILASQSVCLERDALSQIHNRFIFNSSSDNLQLAFPEFSGDQMNVELNKEKGLCYMTQNGGTSKKLFKAAYSGKTNESGQRNIAKKINDKFPGSYPPPIVSGNEEPLLVYQAEAPFIKFTSMEPNEDDSINVFFGQSALSNDLSSITFKDSDFSNYLIFGELKKVRSIEASIGLSFLYALKQYEYEIDSTCLTYLELNSSKDSIRNPSPFDVYKDELAGFMTYVYEEEEIISSIKRLYNEFLQRKEAAKRRSREIQIPKLLIVNSFSDIYEIKDEGGAENSYSSSSNVDDDLMDLMNDDNSVASSDDNMSFKDQLIDLYENGYECGIYVVMQDRRKSSLNQNENFGHFSKVICCDKDESINCTVSENGDYVTITELPENYVILYPDVSKVRPFVFDKTEETKKFIDRFVGVLKND